jgi:hypothetical protein
MKRCREGPRTKPSGAAATREDSRVEAILKAQLVLHSDAPSEADELLATGKEYVLPVVDFNAVNLERGGAAAEQAASLKEFDARAGLLEA